MRQKTMRTIAIVIAALMVITSLMTLILSGYSFTL